MIQDASQLSLFDMSVKSRFLSSIRASDGSKYKYKRVVTSPIRYAGGKSLAVGLVIELLPEKVTKVVSPFFGGGSIEIAISKYLNIEVQGYDIFDILVNYWKFQIENPELLYEKLAELKPDLKTYEKVKDLLTDHWDKTTKTYEEWAKNCKRSNRYKHIKDKEKPKFWDDKKELEPLDLAVYYFFNHNLSYGPGFLGWASDIYLNELKYCSMLESVRNFKPGKLSVSQLDFRKAILNSINDFLYCDPPYYIGEDSKMFKGIYPMRNIPIHHEGFAHEELAELLLNHKGGFLLSYNDCPTIRELYTGCEFYFPEWQYTMGQGEIRIGKNRIKDKTDHVKFSHEILIYKPSGLDK